MLVNIHILKYLERSYLLLLILFIPMVVTAQTITLEECIESVIENNTRIKLSKQDTRIAIGNQAVAKTAFKPKVVGDFDYKYYVTLPYQLVPAAIFGGPEGEYKEAQFGVPHILNAGVQVSMPIYNPVARNALKKTAAVIELREIMEQSTKEELILEASNIYYNAQIILNTLSFVEGSLVNAEKLYQTISLLHQQLLAMGTDVDKVKLQIEQLQSKKALLEDQYQQAINGLNFLMGKPLETRTEVLADYENEFAALPLPQVSTEIKLLQKNMELKNFDIEGLDKSKLPTVALYGMYGTTGYGNTGDNSFFDLFPVGFVGVKSTIPIFDGFVRKRQLEVSQLEVEQILTLRQLLSDKTDLEIKNAELQYTSAQRNISLNESQIQLAEKIYTSTILQHKQGVASITDILLADIDVEEAQQNLLLAIVNLRKAELEYKKVSANLLNFNN